MPLREVIRIDEERCDGCGVCITACAEAAIRLVDGKARLISDAHCDGLGACLGECPQGAISLETVETVPFAELAASAHLASPPTGEDPASTQLALTPSRRGDEPPAGASCPGSRTLTLIPNEEVNGDQGRRPSQLRQWPIQLHLVSPTAPYFRDADVLLAADCVAFAVGDFHHDHLHGRSLAIACPKLDTRQEAYLEKLRAMVEVGGVRSLTVMVMQVPCCSGLVALARQAIAGSRRSVPLRSVIVGLDGQILADREL